MIRACANIAQLLGLLVGLAGLTACAHTAPSPLQGGDAAYGVIPAKVQHDDSATIRPGDRLFISVVGEPDLTSDKYAVDAAGFLQFPLVEPINTAGMTLADLREAIRVQLGRSFIRNPQVAVSTLSRSPAVFAVEGNVREPGVFEATPETTLLSALAQAKSPTRVAQLDDIVVLREVNGQTTGARFDLKAIRNGTAPNPQILAGDTIVVGFSQLKGAWRDLLEAAPLFNFFYLLK